MISLLEVHCKWYLYSIYLPNYTFLQPTSNLGCSAKTHSRLGGQGKSSGKGSEWGAKFEPGLGCAHDNRATRTCSVPWGTTVLAWDVVSLIFSPIFSVMGVSLLAQRQWLLADWVGWLPQWGVIQLCGVVAHIITWCKKLPPFISLPSKMMVYVRAYRKLHSAYFYFRKSEFKAVSSGECHNTLSRSPLGMTRDSG